MITSRMAKIKALRELRDKIDIIYDEIFVTSELCADFVACCESCGKHSDTVLSNMIQCRDKMHEMANLCDSVNELVCGAMGLEQKE